MSKLVKNCEDMNPMLAVLRRYNIGTPDKYERGLWIEKSDLQKIEKGMESDTSLVRMQGMSCVKGTNKHNYVTLAMFEKLFQ